MEDQGLVPCPICKERIQAGATKCRFCNEWIGGAPIGGRTVAAHHKRSTSLRRAARFAIGAALAIVVVIVVWDRHRTSSSKGDICERVIEKSKAGLEEIMSKIGFEPKPTWIRDAIEECRSNGGASNPTSQCVLAAADESGVRKCLLGDADLDVLSKISKLDSGPWDPEAYIEYSKKSKTSEAELNLNKLKRSLLKLHQREGQFPAGRTGLTPAKNCCGRGLYGQPKDLCPPTEGRWSTNPLWSKLSFAQTEPHQYRYAYEGGPDGQSATVLAVGDLDCDNRLATWTLRLAVVGKEIQSDLTPPPKHVY